MTHRTALITGGSSGIGAVYAERLARRGHYLILVARDFDRLKSLANRLSGRSRHGRLTPPAADLTSAAALTCPTKSIRDVRLPKGLRCPNRQITRRSAPQERTSAPH